ncbi:hypothetical protein G4Y79_12040 [Phototrophicus methaneseepsis]|uniref:NADH:quinone oxidoreductase/Mrp antiporter transmembrane domain-containing protein n=1 Tax=Phototrophicus methaneseepsis TaxID=2710758 RepID=A0A7S8EDQ2_9CHLR|nr:proton-conducting transporter membrane subunit [Phototrophicus methaneseepsis]QPC85059.1 hypothetical protein G4Y79_12040 [Phototrophicus methaneseepsis]
MSNNNLVLGVVFIPFFTAIIGLLFSQTERDRTQRYISLMGSALTCAVSLFLLTQVLTDGPQVYRMGGFEPPFGIILVADNLSALFSVMASTVLMMGVLYAVNCQDKCLTYPAFMPLFLFMEVGLNGALLTGDLFTFFVFMELMVLSSVSLVAISDDRYGPEAAMKYIFISGMGTLFLLLGIAAMYATFGTLNLADMGEQLATGQRPLLARSAAIMLIAAFLLKSAVFPFHFWQPDFHTTAPTPLSAMLSSVVVKVGIYGILRLVTLLFAEEAQQIEQLLVILGVIGIFFGSLSALQTYNGKRMLAYSTIGQVGFILVCIGWGTPLALAAAIIYSFNHAFIKSALLMLMGVVASRLKPKSADFRYINGIGYKLPWIIGALWFMGGMALSGLPPMNGFISKLAVAQSGVDDSQWLPLFLVIGSGVLTLIYMFRTWQNVFQTKAEPDEIRVEFKKKGDSPLAPALLLLICLFLGLYARPLVDIANATVAQLSDPSIYIGVVGLFGG